MGQRLARTILSGSNTSDVLAFDPGKGLITVVINITGTITVNISFADDLLADVNGVAQTPGFVATSEADLTDITSSITFVANAVPAIKFDASAISGGTAVISCNQEGMKYDMPGHAAGDDI